MKKNYFLLQLFAILLSFAFLNMGAQALSGAYTIDKNSLASATNFISFNAFATAINANGISAPVTVNVVTGSGPYNEQVTLNQITGAGANARVTINGNGNVLTFNANSTSP